MHRSQSPLTLEALALSRRLKRTIGRLVARIEFASRLKKRLTPLSDEQVVQYRRDGFLLASGLVPEDVVSQAEAAMWETLGAAVHSPETWDLLGPAPRIVRDQRLVAAYTDSLMAAAAQLAGEDMAGFRRPTHAFTINNPPVPGPWQPHPTHLDAVSPGLRHRTFPRPYSIGVIVYLTDAAAHGGGTIVHPGSHLKLRAFAGADPRRYRYLAALNADLGRVDLGAGIELTPSRGQVLFFDYLCAHAASANVGRSPRLAMLHKW